MASFHRVDTSKLVRGAARLMYADSDTTKPTRIADVIKTAGTSLYDPQTDWLELGATREGIQIAVNNTEDAFDVDQVQGDIGTAPNAWTCTVSANLAEVTFEHLIIAWEGADITTNTITSATDVAAVNERITGFAGATSYTERRLAVLFKKPNDKLVGYFFHRAVRAPQEGVLNFQKSGDAQTIPMRWNILGDATETDSKTQFFKVMEQV